MASYQVPQFIDSGDKILLNLNIRQFAYAVFGVGISGVIYVIITSILPSLGPWALIPASPFGLLGLYIAFGSFNGREVEVYVFKSFLYFFKPRKLVYARVPVLWDIKEKEVNNTEAKILLKWRGDLAGITDEKDPFSNFDRASRQSKVENIQNLADILDEKRNSVFMEVQRKSLLARDLEKKLEILKNEKR